MAKKKSTFICISCGNEYVKWHGRCPHCDEWNSIVETEADTKKRGKKPEAIALSHIDYNKFERIKTKIEEFNLVCGGGLVPGSTILIGGEPGIGKSTLSLQIASSLRTLYISGEESPIQIRIRAERLQVGNANIIVSSNTTVDDIMTLIRSEKPECVVIDSIQTLNVPDIPGLTGSVSQIRESAIRLADISKKLDIPILLIGHITKDGAIAGPKLLEHIVDTVLYFEGDFSREYRMLRAFKNRFGSVNEIGLFKMTERGLIEVQDKNIFINSFSSKSPGNAITTVLEGSRALLFEVQSLVTPTTFANPRRISDGFDLNRMIILIAVLEKHALLKLCNFDVFINVSGGFRIDETSADLAVAMAIASSLKNSPIPSDTGFLSEIALSGELRPVSQCQRRIQEFKRSGFRTILLSKSDYNDMHDNESMKDIVGLNTIAEAMDTIF